MMFFAIFLVFVIFMISLAGLIGLIIGIIFLALHLAKKKSKKGKSFLVISLIFIIICVPLTALFPTLLSLEMMRREIPTSIKIDKKIYETGFYEGLYPDEVKCGDKSYIIKLKRFKKVINDNFDMAFADIETADGIVYCEKSKFEQAKVFYADDNNFTFYYKYNNNISEKIETITNPDYNKFIGLQTFLKNNRPSEVGNNSHLNTRKIPYSEYYNQTVYNFYKTSNDNLFSTRKNYQFYNINGKLVYLITSDYNVENSEASTITVVDLPDEISSYLIGIVNN